MKAAAPQISDLFEAPERLKADYAIDELSSKLQELKNRFKVHKNGRNGCGYAGFSTSDRPLNNSVLQEINFDAVLSSSYDLKRAGVTDTSCKTNEGTHLYAWSTQLVSRKIMHMHPHMLACRHTCPGPHKCMYEQR
jgi:hypothetical protein